MLKKLALVFGAVFVHAGISGLVPDFTTTNGDEELLLGIGLAVKPTDRVTTV